MGRNRSAEQRAGTMADGTTGQPWDRRARESEAASVRPAEFVTTEDGTGIVHVAPAYGEDDLKLGQKYGVPVVHGVGEDGYFLKDVKPVAGE